MAFKPIQILIGAKDEASKVLDGLSAKVKAVGVAVAAYFGVSAFTGMVKGAADLEEAMSKVQAATGATAEEMKLMGGAVDKAISGTKLTAIDAAGALENLGKAGLSATDSMQTLPAVVKLAAAGNLDLASSADFVTKTIMGLGLSFSDAGRVADVLAKGANATNTSVEGLGQALSYTAPIARTLGVSLEGTVAMIGKLADAGIDASRAGTALNSIMSQFANPASLFRKELSAAGISTNNFEEAIKQLAAAGPRGSKAINAVGLEAGPALRSLLNQGMAALSGLKKELENSGGSAQAFADILRSNLNGSLGAMSQAWTSLTNTLAKPVLPVLQDGIDKLAATFRNWVADGTIGKMGDALAKAFDAGIQWVTKFIASFDLDSLTKKIQQWATDASAAFEDFGNKASAAGALVQTAYAVMSAGANAVMAVFSLLGAAAAEVLSKIQEGIALRLRGMAKITFGDVSKQFSEFAQTVQTSAEATGAAADALAENAREAFLKMADSAQDARDGFDKFTGTMVQSREESKALAEANKATAQAVADTAQKTDAAAKSAAAKAQADAQQKAALAELNSQYSAAIASGNWQKAAELQEQIRKAAAGVTEELNKQGGPVESAAERISRAFQQLGITSQAELQRMAKDAKENFEVIKNAGESTLADKANAWKSYADKAIAANNGVATAAIEAEASMRGYEVVVDAAGKSTLRLKESNNQLADSHHRNADAIDANRTALEKLNAEREREIAAQEKANELKERELKLYQEKWNIDKEGFSKNTAGNRIQAFAHTRFSVYNQAIEAGLSEEEALRIADSFGQDDGYGQNASVSKVNNAINAAKLQSARDNVAQSQKEKATSKQPEAAPAPAPAPAPVPSSNHATTIVNLTLENTKFTIPTDDSGRENIEAFLKKIGYAAKVSQ